MDYAGPVDGKMILVVIDAHSKWIEAIPLTTATALTTIQQLRKLFAQFGIPDTLVSDNGPQFSAMEFQEFCRTNGIRHTRVAPYHPSSNGLAERAVKIVKQGLKKQAGGTMSDQISCLLFQYRITPQTTTGVTPAELLLGRKSKSRLDLLKPRVESRVEERQSQQKAGHDKRAQSRQFHVGDSVFVRNHNQGDRWLSGTIIETSGPLSYKVRVQNGRDMRCHQDHLRKRDEVNTPPPTPESEEDTDLPIGDTPAPAEDGPHPPGGAPADTDSSTESSTSDTSGTSGTPNVDSPTPRVRTYPSRARTQPNWYHNEYRT